MAATLTRNPKPETRNSAKGTVYLVGAGPGDPKLLTLRGAELLQRADVVVYDHLVWPRLLKHCAPDAELVYAGKEPSRHSASQSAINRLIVRKARLGKRVVRLKGGDPFLFGRGGEEALELARARVPFEIVPGVTSAIAAPAYAGIPLTERSHSSSVAIVTGHEDPTKPESRVRWEQLAPACDTLVCLMGVGALPGIVEQLIRFGRSPQTPCALIEWGTCPSQRTVSATLQTIVAKAKRLSIRPPSVFIAGEVASLRDRLSWFEKKPLFGKRFLITRSAEKAAALSDRLESLGAQVEELSAIELAPVGRNGLFQRAMKTQPKPDWVFFTSPEGMSWLTRMLRLNRKDVRWLAGCHIGAIGPKTAMAIEAQGLHVDFVPRAFSQEGMLESFPKRLLEGKRAWIFSAAESRDALERGLRDRGMRVQKISIYQTLVPKTLQRGIRALFDRPFDGVSVTSASCVEHLFAALQKAGKGNLFRRLPFASIGPVTSSAVRSHGGQVAVEARVSTIEGLAEALVRHFKK